VLDLLAQVREWLSSILIASFVVGALTLSLRSTLKTKSAAIRLGANICGLTALVVVGLMPLLPVRAGLLQEPPRWMPTTAPARSMDFSPAPTGTPYIPKSPVATEDAAFPIDWFPLLYVAVASLLVFRLGAGVGMALWLRSQSKKLEGPWRPMPIRLSPKISMPLAIGGFRPCVLLPMDATEWPEEQLRAVYLHEVAHLRNLDWLWQTLANLVSIVHWFNPIAWLINRNLRSDMERLADDSVLLQGIPPSDYATTLVDLAKTRHTNSAGVLGIAFGRRQGLKERVGAILNESEPRTLLSKKRLFGSLAIVGLVFGSLSAMAFGQGKDPGVLAGVQGKNLISGKSKPATPANSYRAQLSDGRMLEVLQISQFDANGRETSWLPNGDPIPENRMAKLPPVKGKPWVKAMLIRYPALNNSSPMDLSVREAQPKGARPAYLNFSGGKFLEVRDSYRYSVCYFGLPAPCDEFSFKLLIQDAPIHTAFTWKSNGATLHQMPGVSGFRIEEINSSEIKGERTYWLGNYKGSITRIRWTNHLGSEWVPMNSFSQLPMTDSEGQVSSSTDDGVKRTTYLKQPKSRIKGFQILAQRLFTCELRQVRMRPNK
jgi:hypothetical protein